MFNLLFEILEKIDGYYAIGFYELADEYGNSKPKARIILDWLSDCDYINMESSCCTMCNEFMFSLEPPGKKLLEQLQDLKARSE